MAAMSDHKDSAPLEEAEPAEARVTDAIGYKENESSGEHVISIQPLLDNVRTIEATPEKETHYVLIIHGTFSRPSKGGKVNWFHPDPDREPDNFCHQLAIRLADGHLGAESVWRNVPLPDLLPTGVRYPFYWDGSNTDQGRKDGAWYLARLMRHISNQDPSARIHLIAHSHGGNVTLKAIEHYILRLGLKSSQSDWPDAVRERFKEAYRGPAEEITRWRRVEGMPLWGWLFPLLVVWRGPKGEKDAEERYPWGYHRSIDSLLRLGSRRKKLYLRHRRMTSPLSNALGKVVFLGTPFYSKRWAKHAALRVTLSLFLSLVSGFILTFLALTIWGLVTDLSINNNTLYVAGAFAILIFLGNLAAFWERTLFRDGNMYHSDKVPWSPAQHALVIQAGKLDEASLALSAEPVARALLLPLIRKATARAGFVAFPRLPGRFARSRTWVVFTLGVFRALVTNFVLLIPRCIFWLVSKWVVGHTFGVMRDIVMGLAFGLDTSNLKNARIYVEERLVLKGPRRDVRTWDVRKLLARANIGELSAMMAGMSDCHVSSGVRRHVRNERDVLGERKRPEQSAVSASIGGDRAADNPHKEVQVRGLHMLESGVGDDQKRVGETAAIGSELDRAYSHSFGADSSTDSEYSFLWDDEQLRIRSDASLLFARLKAQLNKIDHNPDLTRAQFARELQCICCVAEARFREMLTHWQMKHSAYYKDGVIIDALVGFLNDLEVPPDIE